MPWYSLSTTSIIKKLRQALPSVRQVWLADDASAAGKVKELCEWFKLLTEEGKKHGYHVNGAKSWLIVKSEQIAINVREVFGDEVNITTKGKRHLGAALGTENFKKEFVEYCLILMTCSIYVPFHYRSWLTGLNQST